MIPATQNSCFIETRQLVRDYRVGPATVRALGGRRSPGAAGRVPRRAGRQRLGKVDPVALAWRAGPPTAGSVLVDGRDLAEMNAYQRAIYRRTMVGLFSSPTTSFPASQPRKTWPWP